LIFDPATLQQSGSGSITAVICYDFGQQQFPAPDWNDFVVIVLNWWIAALEASTAGSQPIKLQFMDGPYWITATRQGEGGLLLSCIEDRRGAGRPFEVLVTESDLRRELMRAARNVSRACTSAGIESSDLNELRTRLRD
jgi:hypothetical protein